MSGIDIRLIAAHQAKRIAATLALVAIACGVALSIIHIFLGQESEFEPKIVHPLDVAAGVMVMAIGLAFLGHIAKWTRLALLGALIGLGVGSLAMVLPGVWMVIVRHIVTISQIPISDAATLNPLSENSVIGLCIVAASLIYVLRRPQPSLHVPRLSGALLCGLGAAGRLGLIAGREEVYRLGEYGAADSLVVTVDALAALCLGSVAMILPLIGAEVSPLPERLRARMLLWPGIVIVALLLARSVDRYQWQRIGASTHDHLKGTSRLIESRLHAVTMAMADLARHTNGSGHIHSTACPLARLRWLECSEILRSVSEQPIAANDDRVMNESGEVRAPFQLTVIDKEWVR